MDAVGPRSLTIQLPHHAIEQVFGPLDALAQFQTGLFVGVQRYIGRDVGFGIEKIEGWEGV